MTQLVAIKDIASIRTGYTFRKGELRHGRRKLLGLLISDIRETSVIDPSQLSPILWEPEELPPMLELGEVVLAAKGGHNRAALYNGPLSHIVPSSQFLILTLSARGQHGLTPEYLCWALNHKTAQRGIEENRTGTNISSISKRSLQEISVPVPSRAVQDRILALQKASDEQQRVLNALNKNRENMLQGMFQQLLNGVSQ